MGFGVYMFFASLIAVSIPATFVFFPPRAHTWALGPKCQAMAHTPLLWMVSESAALRAMQRLTIGLLAGMEKHTM
ncbi:hypothetical protein B0H10DRAFT_2017374 [Mycena sp. CBHHK59/15]|nr:hypothetical protein B0H10DRAFT_2035462 [Mycena sp. CBHHK59/15]KAJ6621456.1 hypothetical protein B0H10DRAFT_2017374 [Mycena sp. CBHHK59/15]